MLEAAESGAKKKGIEREEALYIQTKKFLQEQYLSYFKQMKKLGSIRENEIKFLKQGVIFRIIKSRMFAMREDNINARINLIKSGHYVPK